MVISCRPEGKTSTGFLSLVTSDIERVVIILLFMGIVYSTLLCRYLLITLSWLYFHACPSIVCNNICHFVIEWRSGIAKCRDIKNNLKRWQ